VKDFIVAVDIGTSKVCTVVGKVINGQIEIAGKGIEACIGLKKGTIVDIDDTANSIKNSVKQAEGEANMSIYSGFVNITGMNINIIRSKCEIDISNENREVTQEDIDKIMNQVSQIPISDDSQIINIFTKQFTIDGCDEILDPLGMVGTKLEVDVDFVVGKKVSVQNIAKSMGKAGLKTDGYIIEALASSQVALLDDEKDMGVILIDVGGGITDVSVIKGNNIIYYGSIPVGGDHITNDISVGIKISYLEAEKIKREYALGLVSLITNDLEVQVNDISEGCRKSVRISTIVEIIEARIQEILALCKQLVDQAEIQNLDGVGLVLTGSGILSLEGVKQIAQNEFNSPVRIADYKSNIIPKPEYSTAIGMLRHILLNKKEVKIYSDVNQKKDGNGKFRFISKVRNFFN